MTNDKQVLAKEVSGLIQQLGKDGDKNQILQFGKKVEDTFGEQVAEEIVEGTLNILSGLNKIRTGG